MATIPIHVRVQEADFVGSDLLHELRGDDYAIGALVSFTGLVREMNLASDVVALELEHYPGMTESSLRQIAQEAALRWPLQAVSIVHRVGKLYPGDQIVLVATASAHRHAAFAACECIMDQLKAIAPFWKKEWTPEGARWVDARESDTLAAQRWREDVQA